MIWLRMYFATRLSALGFDFGQKNTKILEALTGGFRLGVCCATRLCLLFALSRSRPNSVFHKDADLRL